MKKLQKREKVLLIVLLVILVAVVPFVLLIFPVMQQNTGKADTLAVLEACRETGARDGACRDRGTVCGKRGADPARNEKLRHPLPGERHLQQGGRYVGFPEHRGI